MKRDSALNPEFDVYAEDYDAALQRGLSVSGESKEFFAKARMDWLGNRLGGLNYKPQAALDFGCGTGTSAPLLLGLQGVKEVVGVEVSERSIEVAKKLHSSKDIRFSLIGELEPAGKFDLAFCNGVFHHISKAERPKALEYIFRSLRPGGLFAFWENNPWNPGTRLVMSRIPFDKGAVTLNPLESRRILTKAGFRVCFTDFLFFFPRCLGALRPLEPVLRRIPLGGQYLILAQKGTRS